MPRGDCPLRSRHRPEVSRQVTRGDEGLWPAGSLACDSTVSMVSWGMLPLSPHLFWDAHPEEVDLERHAPWLVKRVLEYGRWQDWRILVATYGKDRLAEIVVGIRSLDPKAAAFCRVFFSLPASALRCSASIPSPTPSETC